MLRLVILTEYRLHFARQADGSHRCVEHPDLVMLPGDRYRLGDREYATLEQAVAYLTGVAAIPFATLRRRGTRCTGR